jgi:hypothetical protein
MIQLHPQFLPKDGRTEYVVLPYEEFLALQELLERICEENFKSEKRHFIIKNGVFGGSFA